MLKKYIQSIISSITKIFNINKLKYYTELRYWQKMYKKENYTFEYKFYQKRMLEIANEPDDSFLKDKIIADFGCGPRGSLVWTDAPKLKIGIDVLADKYFDSFGDKMINHGYPYTKSTERYIPLPNNFVDIVFTMNALDHTANFEIMLAEVLRILKPGGIFIASFNLNEPPSITEPQTLSYEKIEQILSRKIEIAFKRFVVKNKETNEYIDIEYPTKDICILWLKGIKS